VVNIGMAQQLCRGPQPRVEPAGGDCPGIWPANFQSWPSTYSFRAGRARGRPYSGSVWFGWQDGLLLRISSHRLVGWPSRARGGGFSCWLQDSRVPVSKAGTTRRAQRPRRKMRVIALWNLGITWLGRKAGDGALHAANPHTWSGVRDMRGRIGMRKELHTIATSCMAYSRRF